DCRGHFVVPEILSDVRIERLSANPGLGVNGPLVLGAFDDAKIANDRVELAVFPRPEDIGRRDSRQQTNDGHHDHDFHEREGAFVTDVYLHSTLLSSLIGVNDAEGDLY